MTRIDARPSRDSHRPDALNSPAARRRRQLQERRAMLFESLENRSLLATITGNTAIGGFEALNSPSLLYQLNASTLALANGAPVTAWNNAGAAANNFTQGDVAKQPSYVASGALGNSQPAVSFDGSIAGFSGNPAVAPNADELLLGTSTSPATVFIVNSTTSNNGLDGIIGQELGDFGIRRVNSTAWQHPGNSADLSNPGALYVNGLAGTNPAAPLNTSHILTAARPAGAAIAPTSIGDYFQVGANQPRSWGGQIGDVLALSRTLTTFERSVVENALSAKYNIVLAAGDAYAGDAAGNGDYDFGVFGIGGGSFGNISLGKPATQSSEYPGFPATNAVDGILTNFTHTNSNDATASLTIDLGSTNSITDVLLRNRGDGCCQYRLRDVTVELWTTNPALGGSPVFTSPVQNPGNVLNGPATIPVPTLTAGNPTSARWVVVRRTALPGGGDDNNVLSLGEVVVTGIGPGSDLPSAGQAGFGLENAGGIGAGNTLLAGYKLAANSVVSTDLPAGVDKRWDRAWYVDKTGTMGATLAFDFSDSGLGAIPASTIGYQLLYSPNNNFEAANSSFSVIAATPTVAGDTITFAVPNGSLNDGYYTLGLLDQTATLQAGSATANDGAADAWRIVRSGAGGANLDFYQGATLVRSSPYASITAVNVVGSNDNDTFTVDQTGGVIARPVNYSGGGQTSTPGDSLVISGGSATTVTHTFINNNDGSVNVDGSVITYTGLEPITDNMVVANRVFTFTGAAETISIADVAGAGITRIDSSLGEFVDFAVPTSTLTINTNGGDTTTITSFDAAFNTPLMTFADASGTTSNFNLGAANIIPNVTGLILTGNVNFSLNGFSETIASLASTDATPVVTLSTGQILTVGDATSTVYSGTIVSGGALTKIGGGTLTLSGANSYSGATTVSAGTLALQNTYGSPSYAIAAGAVLELNVAAGTRDYVSTSFSGAGTLRKTGAGTALWGGSAATFGLSAGALIDIQGGNFTGGSSANENWTTNLSDLNVAAGATFSGVEANVRVDKITGTGTIQTGYTGAGYVSFVIGVNNGSSTFGGPIANTGGHIGNLTKIGTGTITLSTNVTYTGSTTVSAGTLVYQGTYGSTSHSIASGAVLELNVAAGSRDYASSSFSGTGTLRKTGAGSALWGATAATFNLGAGALIDVQAGNLTGGSSANENWTTNLSDLNVAAGATFNGVEANVRVDKITGAGTIFSGFVGAGYVSFNIGVNNGSSTFAGVLANTNGANPGSFTKLGTGIITLTNAETFTLPLNINAGVIVLSGGGTTSIASTININNGGTLRFGRNDTWGNHTSDVSSPVVVNAGGVVESNGFYNTLVNPTLNGGVVLLNGGVNGSFPALAFKGTVTVGGAQASQINVGAGSFNFINIGDDTLGPTVFNVADSTGNANADLVVNGVFQNNAFGGIGLTKTGVGTMLFTTANTYTGPTAVNGGTLQLQNGAAISDVAGAVSVALGATLQLLNNETISSYVGAGDIGVGTNDSLLNLGANTLTTTGSAAIANVTTAAGGGIIAGTNITDSDDDNNVSGSNVFMQAGTGIGTAVNPIETAVGAIQLRNTTSGVINVLNSNAGALLTVSDLRALGFGARNDGGATTVINSGPLTIAAPSVSAGPVLMEARDNGSVVNADLNTSDGGFTVVNGGAVESPWTYNAGTGKWFTNGTASQGVPTFSELNSAAATVTVSGAVTLSFRHRYSFEFDGTRWDGGQVRISVNGGAFTTVPAGSFSAGGYDGVIAGNNILTGQQAFNGDSAGYATNNFVTSVANLGAFVAGDTIRVQFVGAWDEFAAGTAPNWEIDTVSVFTPSAVAGDDLTIGAGVLVQSTGSSVTLNAGDNLIVAGNVTSATVTAMNVDAGNSDAGVGGNLSITGIVTTPVVGSGGGAFINGQTDNDTFSFNPQTTTEFRLFGDSPLGTLVGDTLVMNVTGTANPNLTVPGSLAPYNGLGSGAWSFTSAHRPVLFGSIEQSNITGNYHLTYDNGVTPVGNLFVMRDAGLTNFQLRDGSTAGPIVFQGSLATILSLRILGSAGNDIVTVDDINTLPDFVSTVPGVTDNGNLAGTAELLFDGLGGTDTLVYNINGASASQQYAIGNGSGAAGLQGEISSVAAGVTLNAYFQNVELTQRTGIGATPAGLTLIGDSSANAFATQANAALTRTTITGYTPFEFSGNNYNSVTINALAGTDSVDLVSLGSGQTNSPPINLNGGTEDDLIRVRSTSLNTGVVTLTGNAGNDLFQLFDAANTVDTIVGPVVVDGTDGNVGGNTDTLTIVDSGDASGDTVLVSAVNPIASQDYAVEGITSTVGNDVVLRNIDVLNYTSTAGNDNIDARFVNTVPLHDLNTVNLSGWTGADQFLLFTSDQIGGSGAGVTPTGTASGVANINLFGDAPGNPNAGDGNDTFGATPIGLTGTGVTNVGLVVPDSTRMIRPSASTSIAIDGGQPTGLAAPLGDVIGDVLNVDISALPNSTPVVVSTFAPGTVVAVGIQPLTWTQIEDINLVDQGKLTNVQMGDLFARTTPGADLVQITRNPTALNPNQVRLRITASIANYSASNKTIIYGGDSNDTITQSNLTIPAEFYGEAGDDVLSGATNNDWLVGGLGSDRINGGAGDNVIWGDNSPTLPADPNPQDLAIGGDDQLSGLGGNDVFYGGGGNDSVSSGAGNDYANGGQGNDTLDGSDGDDRLYGGLGNDRLEGSSGNDVLTGGAGDDQLLGGTGNDVLLAGSGADQLLAGDGNDLLVSGSVANENSSRTSLANTATYSSATYTNGADNDAAMLTLLAQWGSASNRSSIAAITHDGVADDLSGGLGDDDFCWETADILSNFPSLTPADYNAFGMGTDERFGPT